VVKIGEQPSTSAERLTHWDGLYERTEADRLGWYQPDPAVSLKLIRTLDIAPDAGIIDIGGGASTLVAQLVGTGFSDLTVLDISPAALEVSRQRVGEVAPVTWLVEDLLTWEPQRTYDLWHDRAVFHFLSGPEVGAYVRLLDRALAPGGALIIGTFALDAPERCSGLPVTRYSAADLHRTLGKEVEVVEERREVHTTPGGVVQPFTWVAGLRSAS
jgi:SAM-dependent methyltransferase